MTKTPIFVRRSHPAMVWALVLLGMIAPTIGCEAQEKSAKRTPDVIFVPTPIEVVNEMLAVAKVGKNDILYDLGSGDGRIVITAAKRFGTRGIGIDIDPKRIAESRHNADTANVEKLVEFREADLFQTDLRNATVITLYLLPRLNVQLRPKLFKELRPGTRIVSHAFDMGEWQADSTLNIGGRTAYYWVIPANVSGTWNVISTANGAERRYQLRLTQQYQNVTGTATSQGRSVKLNNIRVKGDQISFTVIDSTGNSATRMAFQGRVNGRTMTGANNAWKAQRVEQKAVAIAE
jgi:hypothetical protein